MTLQIFMDDARKEERQLGREEGREEGELIKLVQLVCKKIEKGKSVSEIADALEEAEDTISRIVTIASQYAPEYDVDAICKELLQ